MGYQGNFFHNFCQTFLNLFFIHAMNVSWKNRDFLYIWLLNISKNYLGA